MLGTPELRRVLGDTALVPVASTPEAFAAFVRRDVERQTVIARRLSLRAPTE